MQSPSLRVVPALAARVLPRCSGTALLLAAAGVLAGAGCRAPRAHAQADASPRAESAPVREPRPARPVEPSWQGGPLTIRQAVRLSLDRNPDVRSARARVEGARAVQAAAAAALWPRLAADVTVLHSDAPSTVLFKTIDAHALDPNQDFNSPGAIDNTEAGLGVAWNLWRGGRDRLAYEAARVGVAVHAESVRATRNSLAMAVVAACLDARAAGELLQADEASLRSIESQIAEVRSRVEQGAALRSDQLSLEVRLAEARERKLRTELGRRLALAALRNLIAFERDDPLELATEPFDPGTLPASLGLAQAVALAERPEFRAAGGSIERARLDVEAARRAWLPQLDFHWRWYAGENDFGLDLGEPNSTAALSLSLPLFEGGSRRAALARARASRAALTAEQASVANKIALEVETAWLSREEARERVDVATQAVGASQETLELVEKQFRAGAAAVTRFLEAEAARSAVESSLIRARLDLERSQAELARAVGVLGALGGEAP